MISAFSVRLRFGVCLVKIVDRNEVKPLIISCYPAWTDVRDRTPALPRLPHFRGFWCFVKLIQGHAQVLFRSFQRHDGRKMCCVLYSAAVKILFIGPVRLLIMAEFILISAYTLGYVVLELILI